MIPDIRVDEFEGFQIVRDDLVLGGTKRRALDRVFAKHEAEAFVYATPAFGFAQIAIALAARDAGKKAVIVVAKRAVRHPRTSLAVASGAEIVEVGPAGYLSVVQKRARDLAVERGYCLLPFGLDDPVFIDAIAEVALDTGKSPSEVWSVAGSGVLTRGLQQAWPAAEFHAVQVGKSPNAGRAKVYVAPEKFEKDAEILPPFPSCENYDAKAWRFMRELASPGALFWNVGADQVSE